MTKTRLDELLGNGEGLATEFKRCSGKVEHDVFESICAFLNRFGGDVLLGVEDDGTVVGIKGDPVALRNNIMNIANDGNVFDPVAYIAPEIVEYDGKTIISVHVPASSEIHAYKGVVYDRNGDADVRVRSTAAKANTLIHREFTSSRPARFVIERSRMYVENACRASSGDALTPENFVPDPRNPIIANFFRVIGYADQLGSGVRNLFKYAKAYGGSDPKLKDGDMFRIEVSLKTLELAQIGTGVGQSNQSVKVGATMEKMSATREKTREETTATREKTREKIIAFLSDHPSATQDVIANSVGLSVKGVEWNIKALKDSGRIRRVGPDKGGHWEVVSQ